MTADTENTDTQLVERVKGGDTEAFRHLVEKYKEVSLTLACSVLKDQEKAEDVLQEVFMKVFDKMKSFRHKSAFSTWLYRIVINTSYNALKSTRVYIEIDKVNQDGSPSNEKTAIQELKEQDQRKYVLMALNKLKADEAVVLRLFYLCDYSLKEITAITNFSPSKIKVDLHRGRKNMEAALNRILKGQIEDIL